MQKEKVRADAKQQAIMPTARAERKRLRKSLTVPMSIPLSAEYSRFEASLASGLVILRESDRSSSIITSAVKPGYPAKPLPNSADEASAPL